jgi:hypothetical protein
MTIAKLEFYMKRAEVDMDEIDTDADQDLLNSVIQLCEENKHDQAASALIEILDFECSWGNMDCDPSEHLVSVDDILINCSSDNTLLKVGSDDGGLVVTAGIQFEVDFKEFSKPEELVDWFDENGGWACCAFYPTGDWESGWSYLGSDGDNLYVIEWDGIATS